jgi:hypothetical protein
MSGLFELLSTTTGGVLLVAGTLGFSAAACSAPRWATAARACQMNAALSPLWLLLPILLGFVLTWWGNDAGILLNANGVEVPALFLFQLGVSAWVVYRHRRWPFLVLPLAILCCLWQWGLMMGVVLNGVNALTAAA